MRAFLEQYGIAIFIILILGIMVLTASAIGPKVEVLLKQEIKRFTDKSVEENEKIYEKELEGEAIAFYSDDDQSLTFCRVENIPSSGDTLYGKTVSQVYTDIETTQYSYENMIYPAWDHAGFKTVEFKDTIRPVSTFGWFRYDEVETLDLCLVLLMVVY